MIRPLDSSKELVRLLDKITSEYNDYNKLLSNVDLELSDVLHEIQNTVFSGYKGYKLAMKIKELTLKRHNLKAEFKVAQKLYQSLRDRKVTAQSITDLAKHLQDEFLRYIESEYKPRVLKEGDQNAGSKVNQND